MEEIAPLLLVAAIGAAGVFLLFAVPWVRKFAGKIPPMPVFTLQSCALFLIVFTAGLALLSFEGPILPLAGTILAVVGFSAFLPEALAVRVLSFLPFLLGYLLLIVLERTNIEGLFPAQNAPSGFEKYAVLIVWALGAVFGIYRWRLIRFPPMAEPPKLPNQPPEPTAPSGRGSS